MIFDALPAASQALLRSFLALMLADAPTLHLPQPLPTKSTSVSATTRPTPKRRSLSSIQKAPRSALLLWRTPTRRKSLRLSRSCHHSTGRLQLEPCQGAIANPIQELIHSLLLFGRYTASHFLPIKRIPCIASASQTGIPGFIWKLFVWEELITRHDEWRFPMRATAFIFMAQSQ